MQNYSYLDTFAPPTNRMKVGVSKISYRSNTCDVIKLYFTSTKLIEPLYFNESACQSGLILLQSKHPMVEKNTATLSALIMSESNSCGVTLSAAESRIEERRLEKIGKQMADAAKSIRNIVIFSAFPIKLLSNSSHFGKPI